MFATIYLPDFYLQAALRHQPELQEKPVAVIDDQEKKAVIIQLNSAAVQIGVHCGMTPSQGLARSLQLVVKTREFTQEKLLQEILLHFSGTLAPYIEATGPGIVTIQFTATKNLKKKVGHVIGQLRETEIAAQAGIASIPDASFLAAHLANPVLQIEDTNEFLATLPIETLTIVERRFPTSEIGLLATDKNGFSRMNLGR